jgi:hypothetical protein
VPDGLLEYAGGLYASLWPALLGAVCALYFHPVDGTRADRLFAGGASVAVAVLFGPAVAEYFEVESGAIHNAILGLLALFGLPVAGQVMTAIREVGLAGLLREWVERWFGLKGRQ